MSLLSIRNLHVSVDDRPIICGIDLDICEGEIHAVMGPNGSGKSTFVNALMGNPRFVVTDGSMQFQGKDLLSMEPHERAQVGLFLAFQYPKEIAGVTLQNFLFAAYKAQHTARHEDEKPLSPFKFEKLLLQKAEELHMNPSFLKRFLNKGFSGGEKKKAEILQLNVLQPLLALLDETDSGLDVDALRTVADGMNAMRSPLFSALIVTHYARILEYITPDHVHVMVKGAFVESGGEALAHQLEKEGYAKYGVQES